MGTQPVTMRFYIKYLCHLLITFAIAKCLDPIRPDILRLLTSQTIRGPSMGTPIVTLRFYIKYLCHLLITFAIAKCLDPDQARHFVGPDLDLNCLQKLFGTLIVFLIVFLIFFEKN